MRIAIIGAGLAGLTAAARLAQLMPDAAIELVEKSRGFGGRMATRRLAASALMTEALGTASPDAEARQSVALQFDHGAAYFTARDPAFRAWLEPFLAEGLVQPWPAQVLRQHAGFPETAQGGSEKIQDPPASETGLNRLKTGGSEKIQDPPRRYTACPGQSALGRRLAEMLPQQVRLHQPVQVGAVRKPGTGTTAERWQLVDTEGGHVTSADAVICAIPAPQAAAVLPDNCVFQPDLAAVRMAPCLTLMLGLEAMPAMAFDAAFTEDPVIQFIAINSRKPGRSTSQAENLSCLVSHADHGWSAARLDEDMAETKALMLDAVRRLIGPDIGRLRYSALHRWRYAATPIPLSASRDAAMLADEQTKLIAAGDWCLKGRVESAWQSGMAAAETLAGWFNRG